MRSNNRTAADTRAAPAALARPDACEFDRYLLIEDSDDVVTEIRSMLRERSPRGLEVLS
jgi:hypothetical protein